MPKAASLRNLRPWSPGQSGNPKGRPRAPRFTEREQHVILAALAGTFGDGTTQREAAKAMRAVLTNPRTALKAMEFYAKLTRELAASPSRRRPRTTAARPVTITWNTSYDRKGAGREAGVSRPETEPSPTSFRGRVPTRPPCRRWPT
jgi:Family of unknown function (DUF5681)